MLRDRAGAWSRPVSRLGHFERLSLLYRGPVDHPLALGRVALGDDDVGARERLERPHRHAALELLA